MAVIHLATQLTPAGERLVAIKQIGRREEVGSAAHARLLAEARLVFQLTHANICQVLDLGENEEGTFVVIEYVHGCDLGDLIAAADPAGGVELPLAIYVGREVARALDYAHRRSDSVGHALGLVHGDVAPRNVLLSVEGEVKLADFGIARGRGLWAPGSGLVGGTPGFIAPEVVDGAHDLRADVYSLGATIARAIGGAPAAEQNAVAKALARSDLGGVRDILLRATAREPAARFSSAGEMERALAFELSRRYPGFTPSVLARAVNRLLTERKGRRDRTVDESATTGSLFDMHTLIDHTAAEPPPVARPPEPERGITVSVVPGRKRRAARRRLMVALVTGGVLAVVGASLAIALRGGDDGDRVEVVASAPEPSAQTSAAAPQTAAEPAAPPPVVPVVMADAAPPATPRPSRPRAPRKPPRDEAREEAYVSVSATPWGAVFIDGKKVASETPLYRHAVSPGRHEVRVYYAEQKAYSKRQVVVLAPGQHRSIGFER
jgi:serine/threonine-protein kinase